MKPPHGIRIRTALAGKGLLSQREAHQKRMRDRRERQLSRVPGFTPVRNERVEKAIGAQEVLISIATLQIGGFINPVEIREQAIRRVARTLPKPSPSKLYRYRPSKSDSPAYRKGA